MPTNTAEIASTTAAGNFEIAVEDGQSIQVWTNPKLGPGETVAVKRTNGASVETDVIENGKVAHISDKNASILLRGPATFKFYKGETAVATAVYSDV